MDLLKELEAKIAAVVKAFKEQLAGIRSGRPSTRLVENIAVEYFGQKMTVKQLGSIGISLPREIRITVWDRNGISNIVKAVESTLNVKASTEDNLIRINLPALSQERREEIINLIKREAEETRIKIRSLRDDTLKKVKIKEENKEVTEDEKFRLKDQVQKSIDKSNSEIDNLLEAKIQEIRE